MHGKYGDILSLVLQLDVSTKNAAGWLLASLAECTDQSVL
jgi:hypothetical protein